MKKKIQVYFGGESIWRTASRWAWLSHFRSLLLLLLSQLDAWAGAAAHRRYLWGQTHCLLGPSHCVCVCVCAWYASRAQVSTCALPTHHLAPAPVPMPDCSQCFDAIKRGIHQLTLVAIALAIREINGRTQSGRRKRAFQAKSLRNWSRRVILRTY